MCKLDLKSRYEQFYITSHCKMSDKDICLILCYIDAVGSTFGSVSLTSKTFIFGQPAIEKHGPPARTASNPHKPASSFQQGWSACLQILINYLNSVCLFIMYSAHLRTLMFRMSKWFADFWERQIKCFHSAGNIIIPSSISHAPSGFKMMNI